MFGVTIVRPLFRYVIWLGLVLFWLAEGVSMFVGQSKLSLLILTCMAVLFFVLGRKQERQSLGVRKWSPAYGILAAIPLGLILTNLLTIEYVRDYHHYLRLAKSLYATGDYSDLYNSQAWRPPGMAILYGLPISLGISPQISVWCVNSIIFIVLFICVQRRWLSDRSFDRHWLFDFFLGMLICITVVPFLLLPSTHLPGMALMGVLLTILPSQTTPLASTSPQRWFLVGIILGASCLFRGNLLLAGGVLAAAALWSNLLTWGKSGVVRSVLPILALALGTAVVIAPWTIRNACVLNRFVLISTNGGMLFYTCNSAESPREQGMYVEEKYEEFVSRHPDEADWDREGWREGMEAIRKRPLTFLHSFVYRVPRLLRAPTYTSSYFKDQARGDDRVRFTFPIFDLAMRSSYWMLWLMIGVNRKAIRNFVIREDRVPWIEGILAVVVLSSLLFECFVMYQYSFLPMILFLALSKAPMQADGFSSVEDRRRS